MKEGRTVLFVSHNMSAVKISPKESFLNTEKYFIRGDIDSAVSKYLSSGSTEARSKSQRQKGQAGR